MYSNTRSDPTVQWESCCCVLNSSAQVLSRASGFGTREEGDGWAVGCRLHLVAKTSCHVLEMEYDPSVAMVWGGYNIEVDEIIVCLSCPPFELTSSLSRVVPLVDFKMCLCVYQVSHMKPRCDRAATQA